MTTRETLTARVKTLEQRAGETQRTLDHALATARQADTVLVEIRAQMVLLAELLKEGPPA